MKTAVVVDAACDLAPDYVREHELYVLPNALVAGGETLSDEREVEAMLAFHRRPPPRRAADLAVKPCTVGAIVELFLNRLVLTHDRAILIAMSQTRSALFQNATEASFSILRGYREQRRQAGLSTQFYLNVLDSRTVCAGQAVLASEAIRLLRNPEQPFNDLRRLLEEFRRQIRCYLLFDNPFQARDQIGVKGEEVGVGLNYRLDSLLGLKPVVQFVEGEAELAFKARGFDRALADLFEWTKLEIDQGLRSPLVVISYAGDPRLLRQKRAFIAFERHVRQWGVDLMVSVMSATGGALLGPGAVSLAFAVA